MIRKTFWGFFKIVFVVLAAAAVSIYFALSNLDINETKGSIEEKVSVFLGHKFEIKGDISLGFKRLSPVIELNEISIQNSPNGTYKELFTAKKIRFSVSVFKLLTGKLKARRVSIEDPIINYEEINNKSNITDFAFLHKQPVEDKSVKVKKDSKKIAPIHLAFSNIIVRNLTLNVKTKDVKEKYKLSSSMFSFEIDDVKTKVTSNIYTGGKTYRLNILMSPLHEILNKSDVIKINADIVWDKSDLIVYASIKDLDKFQGINLTAKGTVEDIQSELKNFDIEFVDIPKTEIDITASGSLNKIAIKKLDIDILDSSFTIKGNINNLIQGRPNIDLTLTGKTLNLPRIFAYEGHVYGQNKNKETPAYVLEKRDPKVFINVPFPIDLVNKFDAKLNVTVNKLYPMSTMPIENIKFKLALKDGVGTLNPLTANYADGSGEVLLRADASSKKHITLAAIFKAQHISPGKVIRYSGGGQVIDDDGFGNVEIYVKAQGANLSELVGSATGEGILNSTTELKGYDLSDFTLGKDVLKTTFDRIFKSQSEDVKIYCFAANLQLQDGQAESYREIAIQTDKVNIVANGKIDFKKERLDVSIVPVPVSSLGIDTSEFISMLEVKGPIAKPSLMVSGDQLFKSITKLAITTTFVTIVSGGTLTLPVLGVGYLANNWIKAIGSDKTPCKTAINRQYAENTISFEEDKKQLLHDLGKLEIPKLDPNLNVKKNKSVVSKVTEEVITKPISWFNENIIQSIF